MQADGSGGVQAEAEPAEGSNLVSRFGNWVWGGVTYAATKADQAGGAALSYVLTGSASTGESGSFVGIVSEGQKGLLQGELNTVNGVHVQDSLIGTAHLIPLAIDKIEGNNLP